MLGSNTPSGGRVGGCFYLRADVLRQGGGRLDHAHLGSHVPVPLGDGRIDDALDALGPEAGHPLPAGRRTPSARRPTCAGFLCHGEEGCSESWGQRCRGSRPPTSLLCVEGQVVVVGYAFTLRTEAIADDNAIVAGGTCILDSLIGDGMLARLPLHD